MNPIRQCCIAVAACLLCAVPASASLIGDRIDIAVAGDFDIVFLSVVVQEGVVEAPDFAIGTASIDIEAESIVITFLRSGAFGSDLRGWFFADLDWLDDLGAPMAGRITGVTLTTELTGINPTFRADFVNLDFNEAVFNEGDTILVTLNVQHPPHSGTGHDDAPWPRFGGCGLAHAQARIALRDAACKRTTRAWIDDSRFRLDSGD